MDKPTSIPQECVPEAVVNAACESAWPEFRSHLEGQQAWIDADPLRQNRLRLIVIQALIAAQQQGGVDLKEVVCLACGDYIMPMGQVCHSCSRPVSAPPSAPVGVGEAAREVIESINRFRDAGTRPSDGTLVHWEATLHRALAQQPAAVDEKYSELIYAVSSKYPGESRHETALRYIRQAESADHGPAQADTQHQEPTT